MGEIVGIEVKKAPGLELVRSSGSTELCRHRNVRVIEDRRLIQCKHCEIFIEPFEYLMLLATKQARTSLEHLVLQTEVQQLTQLRDQLKSEVMSLKAQKRRRQ